MLMMKKVFKYPINGLRYMDELCCVRKSAGSFSGFRRGVGPYLPLFYFIKLTDWNSFTIGRSMTLTNEAIKIKVVEPQ